MRNKYLNHFCRKITRYQNNAYKKFYLNMNVANTKDKSALLMSTIIRGTSGTSSSKIMLEGKIQNVDQMEFAKK